MASLPPNTDNAGASEDQMTQHVKFEGVKGYATVESARRRGEEIAALLPDLDYRWAVIVLANGRYAPMVVINRDVPGGPGQFLGLLNVCMVN